jgi:uncharacterized SAM-dependent methyltransferase
MLVEALYSKSYIWLNGLKIMPEEKINDLIFKELIKRGYSLDGKTRIWNLADSKLWYLTPRQAQGYLDLEESDDFKNLSSKDETELLGKHLEEIKKVIGNEPVNIVDLGCGDGKKAGELILRLKETNKVRYCSIDISSYMVRKAVENLPGIVGDSVEIIWNVSDFENLENVTSMLSDSEYKRNIFLFLGGTISTFEPHTVLYEIVEAMKSNDIFLMGLGLSKDRIGTEKFPGNKIAYDNFMSMVVTQLGFVREELDFGVRKEGLRTEMFYTIKRDKNIILKNRKISFNEGDQIIVANVVRYTKEEIEKILKIYFEEFKIFMNASETRALAVCRK